MIEVMAVPVIIAVPASVAGKKYVFIENAAQLTAIEACVSEFTCRETLTWTDHMFPAGGRRGDHTVWTAVSADTHRGPEYSWSGGPSDAGGTLAFAGQAVSLTRTASDSTTPAGWTM